MFQRAQGESSQPEDARRLNQKIDDSGLLDTTVHSRLAAIALHRVLEEPQSQCKEVFLDALRCSQLSELRLDMSTAPWGEEVRTPADSEDNMQLAVQLLDPAAVEVLEIVGARAGGHALFATLGQRLIDTDFCKLNRLQLAGRAYSRVAAV